MRIDIFCLTAFISVAAERRITDYTLPGFLSTFQNAGLPPSILLPSPDSYRDFESF